MDERQNDPADVTLQRQDKPGPAQEQQKEVKNLKTDTNTSCAY